MPSGDLSGGIWSGGVWIPNSDTNNGTTGNGVLKARPKPAHAADYIAQQHDLDYIELHLDGISGALNSKSDEANARLVVRCNQLIEEYESGGREYCGYEITKEAYDAARFMRATFNFI